MAIYSISGINDDESMIVNEAIAADSFVMFVSQNFFGLKDLLLKYPEITNTKVKAYCEQHGLDFKIIQHILNE